MWSGEDTKETSRQKWIPNWNNPRIWSNDCWLGGQKQLAENLCTTGQGIPQDFCGIPEICKKKNGLRCRMPHGKYGKFMKTMELLPIFTGVITLTFFHPKRSTSGVRRVGLVVPLQVSPTPSITVSKASNSWPSSKAWVLGEIYQHVWMKLVCVMHPSKPEKSDKMISHGMSKGGKMPVAGMITEFTNLDFSGENPGSTLLWEDPAWNPSINRHLSFGQSDSATGCFMLMFMNLRKKWKNGNCSWSDRCCERACQVNVDTETCSVQNILQTCICYSNKLWDILYGCPY